MDDTKEIPVASDQASSANMKENARSTKTVEDSQTLPSKSKANPHKHPSKDAAPEQSKSFGNIHQSIEHNDGNSGIIGIGSIHHIQVNIKLVQKREKGRLERETSPYTLPLLWFATLSNGVPCSHRCASSPSLLSPAAQKSTEGDDCLQRSTKKIKNDLDPPEICMVTVVSPFSTEAQDSRSYGNGDGEALMSEAPNQHSLAAETGMENGSSSPPEPPCADQKSLMKVGEEEALGSGEETLKSFKEAVEPQIPKAIYFDEQAWEEETSESNSEIDLNSPEGSALLDPKIPNIQIPSELLSSIRQPWKEALIVRLMGETIGFNNLKIRVKTLWEIQGDFDIIDLGSGFFLFKFERISDAQHVYAGGPWVIMDHYLTVRKWEPDFWPSLAKETKMDIWIRLPELPVEYYVEPVLVKIARKIGKPIKMDYNTAKSIRGKYARICVEVDLTKPLLANYAIRGRIYNVEYESIHSMCYTCGRINHRSDLCPLDKNKRETRVSPVDQASLAQSDTPVRGQTLVPDSSPQVGDTLDPSVAMAQEDSSSSFGPWLLVKKPRRGPIQKSRPAEAKFRYNNRFQPIAELIYKLEIIIYLFIVFMVIAYCCMTMKVFG